LRGRFQLRPYVHAYDVQSAVFVMDRLAAGTGQQRYRELAQKARSWFDGRNPAQVVICDRAIGRVADGLDDGRLNGRSGGEVIMGSSPQGRTATTLKDEEVLALP
jgi:hypothetical protein